MSFSTEMLFALVLIAGLAAVWTAAWLYRRGQRRWLRHYLYYVISFTLLEFLNLVAVFITRNTLEGLPAHLVRKSILLIYIIAFPLSPLPVFFMLLIALAICGLAMPRRWYVFFSLLYAIIVGWQIVGVHHFFSSDNEAIIAALGKTINLTAIIGFYLILTAALVFSLLRKQRPWRMGGTLFAFTTLAGFSLYIFFPFFLPWLSEGTLHVPLRILLFYLQLLPPMLVLAYWQPRFQPFIDPPIPEGHSIPAGPLANLGITPREMEIISLVTAGLSNGQIEDRLFISHHTVKNHLHNIFRKLKINSRMQLVHTLQRLSTPPE